MRSQRVLNADGFKNFCLSVLLLFLCGSLSSLGVFNSAVEKSAKPPGTLNGVWSSSMALMSMFSIPFMLIAGVVLDNARHCTSNDRSSGTSTSIHQKIRLLNFIGCVPYALLGLSPLGIAWQSSSFIQFMVTLQSLPMGIHYLISLEVLGACRPSRPGLLIGFGQLAFGLGAIAFSALFHSLLEHFDLKTVFRMAAAILFLPSSLSSAFLSWPQQESSEAEILGDLPIHEHENQPLIYQERSSSISWKSLLFLPLFWYYIIAIIASQAGYAFYPYFFKIGLAFGYSESVVVKYFQIALFVSALARPLAGSLCDVFKWGNGWFSMGSKNAMMSLLLWQIVMCFGLIWVSYERYFHGFVIATTGILVVFSAGACASALLAREMFGSENSSLVFGMGGGIAMGIGEFVSGESMAVVDWTNMVDSTHPSRYIPFYVVSLSLSLFGLLCCAMMQKYEFRYAIEHGLTSVISAEELPSDTFPVESEEEGCKEYGAISGAAITVQFGVSVQPSQNRYMPGFETESISSRIARTQ